MRADTGYVKLTRFTPLSKALWAGRDEADGVEVGANPCV